MAPKLRIKDRHLPSRVYKKHGAHYYVDINNKWHRLGESFHEAMVNLSERISPSKTILNMGQLFDRYLLEVAPKKAKATYRHNIISIAKLRVFFGDMSPADVTPVHVYQYLDNRGKTAVRSANLEKACLSHVFSCAIKWGVVSDNPCRNVKRLKQYKRDRYITDKEFLAVKGIASVLISLAMDFAYLTALRRGDMLSVKLTELTDEGIEIKTNKTGAKILIEWTEELIICVEKIKKIPSPVRGMYLFCTRAGQKYTNDGFSTLWQRTIRKAYDMGIIEHRFRFHDIRRKSATDAEKLHGREYARQLLGHETQSMTAHYISGQQRVKPVK